MALRMAGSFSPSNFTVVPSQISWFETGIGLLLMVVAMKSIVEKIFAQPPTGKDWAEFDEHTVDDGTNDLVNLANGAGLGAGEPSEGRKAIELGRLKGAACDGGRSSKGSPPEGPGQTAV
jgi:hypothetical protein